MTCSGCDKKLSTEQGTDPASQVPCEDPAHCPPFPVSVLAVAVRAPNPGVDPGGCSGTLAPLFDSCSIQTLLIKTFTLCGNINLGVDMNDRVILEALLRHSRKLDSGK